jgi:hypothetical protein
MRRAAACETSRQCLWCRRFGARRRPIKYRKRVWTAPVTRRCMTRSLAPPSGYQWLRGDSTPPDSSGGQPCHLVKLNLLLNCALRRRARAGLPKLSNTTRRRAGFVLSQTIWRRGRTFLKRTRADAIVSPCRSPSHRPGRPVPVPTRGAADPPRRRSGSAHDGGRVPLAAAIRRGSRLDCPLLYPA